MCIHTQHYTRITYLVCIYITQTFLFFIKLMCVFSFTFSYENIASLLHLCVSIIQSSLVITLPMSKNLFT